MLSSHGLPTFSPRANSALNSATTALRNGAQYRRSFLNPTSFDPVVVNGMPKSIDLVTKAKILGLNISNDLKSNCHIDLIIKKAKKRLYGLSQLKRYGLGPRELVQFFRICIRTITEYACPVFHDGLPVYLSNGLEVYKSGLAHYFSSLFIQRGLGSIGPN